MEVAKAASIKVLKKLGMSFQRGAVLDGLHTISMPYLTSGRSSMEHSLEERARASFQDVAKVAEYVSRLDAR